MRMPSATPGASAREPKIDRSIGNNRATRAVLPCAHRLLTHLRNAGECHAKVPHAGDSAMRPLYLLAFLQALLLVYCLGLGSVPAEKATVVVPPSGCTTIACTEEKLAFGY
jgi:hypothetical protein